MWACSTRLSRLHLSLLLYLQVPGSPPHHPPGWQRTEPPQLLLGSPSKLLQGGSSSPEHLALGRFSQNLSSSVTRPVGWEAGGFVGLFRCLQRCSTMFWAGPEPSRVEGSAPVGGGSPRVDQSGRGSVVRAGEEKTEVESGWNLFLEQLGAPLGSGLRFPQGSWVPVLVPALALRLLVHPVRLN